jgi:hypothetical protein
MNEWVKVVTHPLGLTGFTLFLVFGYLAKAKKSKNARWLGFAAVAMAVIALVGGLALAYKQVTPPLPTQTQSGAPPAATKQQTNQKIEQTTSGQGSPAVQGVQGDVNITVDQSSGTGEAKKPAAAKTGQNKPKQ